jgi:hypothetical protein
MKRVTEMMEARITKNSPKQMKKAGALWPDLPLNFFYLTNAEDTVDIVVTSILRKVAQEDNITIPGAVVTSLQNSVTPETPVKAAIRLIFLTTFQPQAKN